MASIPPAAGLISTTPNMNPTISEADAVRKALQCFGGMAPGMPRFVDDDILAHSLEILSEILAAAAIGPLDTCVLGSPTYGTHRLSADSTADTLVALWQPDSNQGSLWFAAVASRTTETIEA